MPSPKLSLCLLTVLLAVICAPQNPVLADDWLPITPEELAMKDYAPSPGAHAVILYRAVRTDDIQKLEEHYYRIKILTEQGRKHANVEITYTKSVEVVGIQARTIRPDSSAVNFDGQIFDKTVVKSRGVRRRAKTFTIPDIQVGSIIEYRFTVRWDRYTRSSLWIRSYVNPAWYLQDVLPTRKAYFSFRPNEAWSVAWTNARLPAGARPVENRSRVIEMTVENLPAFEEEDLAPPENELKSWVRFYYVEGGPEPPDKYWTRAAKALRGEVESFIGDRRIIQQEVGKLVAAADPPEEKLRKIYARVQQLRNLSYERERTEQETQRENLKYNENVEDVLKKGYGTSSDLNRLFVAMARAAGFEAGVVLVAERDIQFFYKGLLDTSQLDGEVSVVNVAGQDRYFDPGTLDCPFGMLRWLRSAVHGIRLNKDGGAIVSTPQPKSDQAVVMRKAQLQMSEDGALSGKLEVTFIGQEALTRRYATLGNDEVGRSKQIEDEIKSWLPAGASVKVESIAGWRGFDETLRVQATVEMPGVASTAGRRVLLPSNILAVNLRHPFSYQRRTHPVYLRNPFKELDELTIALPPKFQVESLPQPREATPNYAQYKIARLAEGNTLKLTRTLSVEGFFFPVDYYPALRLFFNIVRAGDEEQMVLQTIASAGNSHPQEH